MTDEIYNKVMDLNVKSTVMSCRAFTPMLKEQGYGRIVNVSSVCDRHLWPTWSVYSATKAAVNAFSKCLYTKLRLEGQTISEFAETLNLPTNSVFRMLRTLRARSPGNCRRIAFRKITPIMRELRDKLKETVIF